MSSALPERIDQILQPPNTRIVGIHHLYDFRDLSHLAFVPSTPDIEKCVVTKETVLKEAPPTLVARGGAASGKPGPRQKRERSA